MRNTAEDLPGVTRVAILSSAGGGGAGIAARRLAEALNAHEAFQADFLTREEMGGVLPEDVAPMRSMTNHKLSDTHYTMEYPGFKRPWVVDLLSAYDVVNIHWTSYLISLAEIDELARRGTRILYMLHDFHHFTGGCHYPAGCTRMRLGCLNCPQVDETLCDINFIPVNLRIKQGIFARANVHLAAPSQYLRDRAVASGIIPLERAHVMRNVYVPDPAPQHFEDQALRLVIVADSLYEGRKGMALTIESLDQLARRRRAEMPGQVIMTHVIGRADEDLQAAFATCAMPHKLHGRISEHQRIVGILGICDIILSCSYEDNWPNVLVEAGSYGVVPVVGPGHGCEEFVRTYQIGEVARDYSAADFADSLIATAKSLPGKATRKTFAQRIREDHSPENVTHRFSEIIADLMNAT